MLVLVFLSLNLSLAAVFNGNKIKTHYFYKPGSVQVQMTPKDGSITSKSLTHIPSQVLIRNKGLATIPSCLEVGELLDRAVGRVNKFNFKSFLHKYDHLIYNRILRSLTRVPPLTASYVILSTVSAVLSYFFNNNFPFSWMTFDLEKVKSGQLWRLFTPFFLFGQLWVNHYMLAGSALTYMANVELAHINNPEKFIEFLAFGVISMSTLSLLEAYMYEKYSIVSSKTFDNMAFHFHVFVLYFWSRINEGQSVEVLDFFSIPSEFLPYLYILQNLLFHEGGISSDLFALALSYLYFTLFSNRKTCPIFKVFGTDTLRNLYLKFRDEIPY